MAEIVPDLGAVVLDRYGRRCQCIVTPDDRRHDLSPSFLPTRFVFRVDAGVHWCVDRPEGRLVPRAEWTARERVWAVMLHGPDVLFDFVEERDRREELFEQALIEAVLGVHDLADAFDLWDSPSYLDRWVLLADEFDRVRRPAAAEPGDEHAVL